MDIKTEETTNNGIGIFGGTFDPIHKGHINSIDAVANWLNLSTVLLIPAYISPHKTGTNETPKATPEQRASMIELASKNNPNFICDRRELSRSGPSFTVDTLKELKVSYPKKTLYFVVGMDSLQTFTQWHLYQEILTLCHLVVNTRPNYHLSELNEETQALLLKHQINDLHTLKYQQSGAIIFAKPIHIDISSSEIRSNIYQQKEYKSQLSPLVIDFINKNQLYR
jgi:nicotinate-nucleotide adenylyltransferase